MLSNPKVENIKIEYISINFNQPFDNPEFINKAKLLLPTNIREKISFYVKDANTSIVNGLRRVIEGELKTKRLTCEVEDIDTNEDFIIKSELIDRINYIPINQNLELNVEFSLNISNTNVKKEFMIVRSSNLIQTNGKLNDKYPAILETFRLAQLRSGKYLIIPRLKIKEDYGYNNAANSLTTQTEYHIIDYISVTFINERANFISKKIKVSELINLFKKYKINSDESHILFRKKILIIPNKNYQKMLTSIQKDKIKLFDFVVRNDSDDQIIDLDYDNKFLKQYHSAEMTPREFFLAITTNGNIDPKQMMILACLNIKDRLIKLQEAIQIQDKITKNNDTTEGFVTILKDNIKTQIIIRGEDYTISQLLKNTIFELDPNIGLINSPLEHPLNRTIILCIMHPQPIVIILDAIQKCLKNFDTIQKYFE